ncbi:MAG: GNAT family protein [Acidobacteriota bacterium]
MIDTLENEFVILKRYVSEDADDLFEAARDSIEEVYPWLAWCHPDYEMSECQEWISLQVQRWNEGKEYGFTIRNRREHLVGGCSLNHLRPEDKVANLGYWVRSGHTGKGYATAATELVAQFAFDRLDFKRVGIVAAVENVPSQRVAERAGAKREGILRNRLFLHGQSHDAIMYSLIAEDDPRHP